MLDRIETLRAEAAAAIAAAPDREALEELRVRFLGRRSELTSILRGIGDLDPTERGPVGSAANAAREALGALLEARLAALEAAELERSLAAGAIDVTLPGAPPAPAAAQSLLVRTQREIEDVFVGLGYRVMEGPEVELDYYNFTALNHPPGHPARMAQDTFYVDPATLSAELRIEGPPTLAAADESEQGSDHRSLALPGSSRQAGARPPDPVALPPGPEDVVLRTHTSPMQVRAMEAQGPPIMIVCPGRCYRSETSDATHSPVFHQVEGLAVGERITLADLKGTLDAFARAIFGPERETRFRPGFFPFTEPSVEVDVSCFRCGGSGRLADGSRDPLCKGVGWIEILGAGMVDPNVLGFVAASGYDPERVQGFAFGMGIERIAMLRHAVPDLRKFFENDVRVLEQFR